MIKKKHIIDYIIFDKYCNFGNLECCKESRRKFLRLIFANSNNFVIFIEKYNLFIFNYLFRFLDLKNRFSDIYDIF